MFTPPRPRKPAHGPTNHRDAARYCRLVQLASPKDRLIHVAQKIGLEAFLGLHIKKQRSVSFCRR